MPSVNDILDRLNNKDSNHEQKIIEKLNRDMMEFDWAGHSKSCYSPVVKEQHSMFSVPHNESPYNRKLRMLVQVRNSCMTCTMCELGRRVASDPTGSIHCDPHVFSNMNPRRFMVVGQNPGWTEVRECMPFVGDSGKNFDDELAKNGLSRDDFYICNTVRCYTPKNSCPSDKHVERCKPFLDIEINLIRPLLVIALGAVAFGRLCPDAIFKDALGKITVSHAHRVPVFAIYHPSPRNIDDTGRRSDFERQMKIMCGVVKKLKEQDQGDNR